MEKYTYNASDIFEEIDGDPNNVIMKIPPEICELQGWKEGDTLNIEVTDGQLVISKV